MRRRRKGNEEEDEVIMPDLADQKDPEVVQVGRALAAFYFHPWLTPTSYPLGI
jgi:hypothetical protein